MESTCRQVPSALANHKPAMQGGSKDKYQWTSQEVTQWSQSPKWEMDGRCRVRQKEGCGRSILLKLPAAGKPSQPICWYFLLCLNRASFSLSRLLLKSQSMLMQIDIRDRPICPHLSFSLFLHFNLDFPVISWAAPCCFTLSASLLAVLFTMKATLT